MGAPEVSRFTAKEYLALEAVAETRHEYVGGDIVAMAGAEPEHNQVVQNLRFELELALRARSCRVAGADQRVFVEATGEYFYPDVVVTRAEPRYVDPAPRSLANPEVIIEVLSPSTERYDRGDKWSAYQTIGSLTDYVMVASTQQQLAHDHRLPDGSWTMRALAGEATAALANGVVLELAKLYRLVTGRS